MAKERHIRLTPEQRRRLSQALDVGLEMLRGQHGQDFAFTHWSLRLGRSEAYLNNVRSAQTDIGPKTARAIAKMLAEPETKWLELTGHLQVNPGDAREAELTAVFTGLRTDLKDLLLGVAKSFRQYQMKQEREPIIIGDENGPH